ncbi:MAG: ribosome small subunit-dependent GTPase A, partial [Lachnospiraceae bacterium]
MQGKIIKGIAGFYVVESSGRRCMCKARGAFRKAGLKPLVGDLVRVEEAQTEKSEGSIEEIYPRKNVLIRPAVSNVDQALVVLALRQPDPQLYLLDEYLLTMERQHIPAAILWNKADLDTENALESYAEIYHKAGYPVLSLSTRTGEGMEALRDWLRGRTTVLAGPSG